MQDFLYICNMIAKMTKYKIIHLFLVLFLRSFDTTTAQIATPCDCFIEGTVVDRITKRPIEGAIVQISQSKWVAITDAQGKYRFKDLCQGLYKVEAQIIGYQAISTTINLVHQEIHAFELTEDEIHLERVDIYAEKLENTGLPQQKIKEQEIQQNAGGSLGDVIKKTLGVSLLQTGHSIVKPVIHGMHSNRVLLLNNGVRQEGQQWGSEHGPEIDPLIADQITVITGAASVKYGSDALAGVVLVEPSKLRLDGKNSISFQQSYFTNGHQLASSFAIQQGFKKLPNWKFRLQGSAKRGGQIHTPTYTLANTGLSELNYSATTFFAKKNIQFESFFSQFNSQIGIFSGSHIGNLVDLQRAIQGKQPAKIYTPDKFTYQIGRPYQDLQHSLWKNKLVWNTNAQNRFLLEASRQYNFRQEVDVLRGDRNLTQTFRLVTYLTDFQWEHTWKPSWKGTWGTQLNQQTNLSTGELRNPLRSTVIIPNYTQTTFGIFGLEKFISDNQKWEVEAGIRYDIRKINSYALARSREIETMDFQFAQFSNSFALTYRPKERQSLLVSAASAWRAPSVNELLSDGVHHGAASYEVGDANLQAETSQQVTLRWDAIWNKKFETEISTFVQRVDNYIFLAPTGEAVIGIRGAFPFFRYWQTNALFRGIDARINTKIMPWLMYSPQVSLLRADDTERKQPLLFITPNQFRHRIDFDLAYFRSSKWLPLVRVEHSWTAEQKRVPFEPYIRESNNENVNQIPLINGDFMAAPPAYHLVDLGLFWEREVENTIHWRFSFQVQNALNTVYRSYLDRFRYFNDAMGRSYQFRLHFTLQ